VRYWIRNEKKILAHVNAMSALFQERLARLTFNQRPEIRVKGLAIAVEFEDKTVAEEIANRCRKNGLLLTTSDNALTMFPPLNIERTVALEGLRVLEKSAR